MSMNCNKAMFRPAGPSIWGDIHGNIDEQKDLKQLLDNKADKSEIPSTDGLATEEWVEQQGYLTEHQQMKTINGEVITGTGNIIIKGGTDDAYTKAEVDAMLAEKADKTEIPSTDGFATEAELTAAVADLNGKIGAIDNILNEILD